MRHLSRADAFRKPVSRTVPAIRAIAERAWDTSNVGANMQPKTSFDIQILRSGRWTTDARLPSEEAARAHAMKLLANPQCEGAKVLRCWLRADGTEMENEIFSKTQSVGDNGGAHLDHVDSVPDACASIQDCFRLDARLMMARLFKSYLDSVVMTPSEMLCTWREFKRLRDKDNLMPTAVDRIATMQTRADGGNYKTRKDDLFRFIEDIIKRAKDTEATQLPKDTKSLSDLVGDIAPMDAPWDRLYLARTALVRDMKDIRSFCGKLDKLCRLALGSRDPDLVALRDGMVAEIFETSAIQDILGRQSGLGPAICAMVDLSEGKMDVEKSEAKDIAASLNMLFSDGLLPEACKVLLDRVHRQIGSSGALYRNDEQQEYDHFKTLTLRLLTPKGLLAGPATAAALTGRYLRMVKECSRKDAVSAVFRLMPDRCFGLVYLSALLSTEYAADATAKLREAYPPTIAGQHITNMVARGLSPKDRMIRATLAHATVFSAKFAPDAKQPVLDHIDRLLDEYLVEEQIIEKLDHQDSSLRERATRLVQFCASGVLPEGRALARARARIKDILRQPNFDANFVADIADPAAAQKALRDFHALLINKAGFGV